MRSKKFCRALSPKQIARLRRTGRRLRHNCGGRDRLTLGSAPFRHCRLSFIRVVAAEKSRRLIADFLARWRDGERLRRKRPRHSRYKPRIRDERAFHIARGHYGPRL